MLVYRFSFSNASCQPDLSHRLDPVLYRKCQNDASRLCHTHGWNETSEMMPPGAVFSCLYRHAYRTEEQGRRVRKKKKIKAYNTYSFFLNSNAGWSDFSGLI